MEDIMNGFVTVQSCCQQPVILYEGLKAAAAAGWCIKWYRCLGQYVTRINGWEYKQSAFKALIPGHKLP